MGSTASKLIDVGLNVLCIATCGLLGKSSEGYHVGPLRIKKDSIGLACNAGICEVGVKMGKNDFGSNGIDASVSSKFLGVAKGSLRAGIDTQGCYGGVSGSLNLGYLRTSGSVVANGSGIRSYQAKAVGPLLTNVKYSNKKGLGGGIFGISANQAGEVDFDILENAIADKIGKEIKDEYQIKCKDEEKAELKTLEDIGRSVHCDICNGPCLVK